MTKLIWITAIITCVFLLAIAVDLTPFLRGPAPYSPDWRWPYQIPHLSLKTLAPILVGGVILITIFNWLKKPFLKKDWQLFGLIIFLGWIFELSLLMASNAGLSVLIHRMINPMISGYFTSATQITSVPEFLNNFTDLFNFYPLFGRFHPPFDILFYFFINQLSLFVTPLFPFINTLSSNHNDVAIIWSSLFSYEKMGAILGIILTQFLSFLSVIPLYYAVKNLLSEKEAFIASTLYILTPSILLFSPLADTIYPFFSAAAFYLLAKALMTKKNFYFFLTGFVLSIGSFFTLTILPLLFLFGLYYLLTQTKIWDNKKQIIMHGMMVTLGFVIIPILLFVAFHLDSIEMFQKMMLYHHQTQIGRNIFTWAFYSPYDFFIFLGLPTTMFFFASLKKISLRSHALTISFLALILMLVVLGSVKGETGRVWIPYVIFPITIASSILSSQTIKSNLIFFVILITQAIIFNLFLVTLW